MAQELVVREEQIAAAVALLDDGATVRVKVLEVDLARKRIALTPRLDDVVGPRADRAAPRTDGGRPPRSAFHRATWHPCAARNRAAAH
jgi:transcriptional accessory protein Tex/SPT6